MGRHPTDHEQPSLNDGLRLFRLAQRDGEAVWKALWKRGVVEQADRRVVEYARIERGRTA